MPQGLLPAVLSQDGAPEAVRLKVPGSCAPPSGFRAAEGVRSAWLVGETGPFGRTPICGTVAQRNGKRYEKKVLGFLAKQLGKDFRPSLWFKFFDGHSLRWCQVDGLLLDARGAVIFEVKYNFTSVAYYQLRRLYEPVVRRALLPKSVRLVVVCRNFDPATPFPEAYSHTELVGDWRESFSSIGVFQWRA